MQDVGRGLTTGSTNRKGRWTVTEIAREAQVAKATVFNYFPAKEDLFFPRLEDFGARLVEAVATRGASGTTRRQGSP